MELEKKKTSLFVFPKITNSNLGIISSNGRGLVPRPTRETGRSPSMAGGGHRAPRRKAALLPEGRARYSLGVKNKGKPDNQRLRKTPLIYSSLFKNEKTFFKKRDSDSLVYYLRDIKNQSKLQNNLEQLHKDAQKKRRKKKIKKESSKKRFYPRPTWLRYMFFENIIKKIGLLPVSPAYPFALYLNHPSFFLPFLSSPLRWPPPRWPGSAIEPARGSMAAPGGCSAPTGCFNEGAANEPQPLTRPDALFKTPFSHVVYRLRAAKPWQSCSGAWTLGGSLDAPSLAGGSLAAPGQRGGAHARQRCNLTSCGRPLKVPGRFQSSGDPFVGLLLGPTSQRSIAWAAKQPVFTLCPGSNEPLVFPLLSPIGGNDKWGNTINSLLSTRIKKEDYTISNYLIGDLKRLLWKSNWLRTNLNPYLTKVKKNLNSIKQTIKKKERTFLNRLPLHKELEVFDIEGCFAEGAPSPIFIGMGRALNFKFRSSAQRSVGFLKGNFPRLLSLRDSLSLNKSATLPVSDARCQMPSARHDQRILHFPPSLAGGSMAAPGQRGGGQRAPGPFSGLPPSMPSRANERTRHKAALPEPRTGGGVPNILNIPISIVNSNRYSPGKAAYGPGEQRSPLEHNIRKGGILLKRDQRHPEDFPFGSYNDNSNYNSNRSLFFPHRKERDEPCQQKSIFVSLGGFKFKAFNTFRKQKNGETRKWQTALYVYEYQRLTYMQLQDYISQIRENIFNNGAEKTLIKPPSTTLTNSSNTTSPFSSTFTRDQISPCMVDGNKATIKMDKVETSLLSNSKDLRAAYSARKGREEKREPLGAEQPLGVLRSTLKAGGGAKPHPRPVLRTRRPGSVLKVESSLYLTRGIGKKRLKQANTKQRLIRNLEHNDFKNLSIFLKNITQILNVAYFPNVKNKTSITTSDISSKVTSTSSFSHVTSSPSFFFLTNLSYLPETILKIGQASLFPFLIHSAAPALLGEGGVVTGNRMTGPLVAATLTEEETVANLKGTAKQPLLRMHWALSKTNTSLFNIFNKKEKTWVFGKGATPLGDILFSSLGFLGKRAGTQGRQENVNKTKQLFKKIEYTLANIFINSNVFLFKDSLVKTPPKLSKQQTDSLSILNQILWKKAFKKSAITEFKAFFFGIKPGSILMCFNNKLGKSNKNLISFLSKKDMREFKQHLQLNPYFVNSFFPYRCALKKEKEGFLLKGSVRKVTLTRPKGYGAASKQRSLLEPLSPNRALWPQAVPAFDAKTVSAPVSKKRKSQFLDMVHLKTYNTKYLYNNISKTYITNNLYGGPGVSQLIFPTSNILVAPSLGSFTTGSFVSTQSTVRLDGSFFLPCFSSASLSSVPGSFQCSGALGTARCGATGRGSMAAPGHRGGGERNKGKGENQEKKNSRFPCSSS
ncbi:MAG: hypothetical protein ACT6RN_26785 [Agrobacterium sp.]|uniref:hypothetical protein n=1 Tax=Agrobacterium sp. TaxID=361 RepID=UPI00403806DD